MTVLFSTPYNLQGLLFFQICFEQHWHVFFESHLTRFFGTKKRIKKSHLCHQALIASNTEKPIVKLLINRHNNKYSYTGASDDNILKNIELFDKLSLRFSNRVRKGYSILILLGD